MAIPNQGRANLLVTPKLHCVVGPVCPFLSQIKSSDAQASRPRIGFDTDGRHAATSTTTVHSLPSRPKALLFTRNLPPAMRFQPILLLLLPLAFAHAAPRYEIIDLGVLPGCESSRGQDLNEKGQVVGWSEAPGHISHAFVWDRGVMTELKIEGATEALARSINNKGEITGAFVVGKSRHTFLWRDNEVLVIGPPRTGPLRMR